MPRFWPQTNKSGAVETYRCCPHHLGHFTANQIDQKDSLFMEIIFTRHALERAEERNISLSEIAECLFDPTKIQHLKNGKEMYYRLNSTANYLLILVCSIKDESCKIITVIKKSQIKKHLGNE